MLKHIWVIVLFAILPKNLLSENFSQIDSLSIKTPNETAQSMERLVSYCEQHTSNDLERVRFYFVWVATHISYDEMLGSDKQNPATVFKNRKAVCSGYARLLMSLCEQSGIPAKYVAGYGKDLDDSTSIQNHAWNIIRIDGKWYPFDVTWAANVLADDVDSPLSSAFEEWFMPRVEQFRLTHLPFDPVYQLSNELVKRSDFFAGKSQKLNHTAGGLLQLSNMNFTDTLNQEVAIDSLERVWRSFRRAYDFMSMDSAVAIKLAKAQEGKVKRVFEFVHQFNKNDYSHISQTSTEVLKNWILRLQELEQPMQNALCFHEELESLPLSELNKRMQQQNHVFFQWLLAFAQKAIADLNKEIAARE